MQRILSNRSITFTLVALALVVLALPGLATAAEEESAAAAEIKASIIAGNKYARENLTDQPGGTSKEGSVEFWSSGGLMQWGAPDAPSSHYDRFSLTAKHIKVIELPGGEAAVAMYYSEGSMQPKGGAAVNHYMTRVLQVFVKEEGEWVVRAAHWSPIVGGSGTSQTSID